VTEPGRVEASVAGAGPEEEEPDGMKMVFIVAAHQGVEELLLSYQTKVIAL
jgi:hypothetical protein